MAMTAAAGGFSLPVIFAIAAAVILVIAVCIVLTVRKKNAAFNGPKTTEDSIIMTCDAGELRAPAAGTVLPRSQIPDETFSSGYLGEGVGILPSSGAVFAPCAGVVTSVENTGHGLQMKSDGKMELLLQAGIDTLDMRGDGFELLVKKGDRVEAGQKLIAFDRDKIEKAGHSDCVVMLVMNASDFGNLQVRA